MNQRFLWVGIAGVAFIAIVVVVIIMLRNRDVGIANMPLAAPSAEHAVQPKLATSSASGYDITLGIQKELDLQKKNRGKFSASYRSAWTPKQIQHEKEQAANRGFFPTSTTP